MPSRPPAEARAPSCRWLGRDGHRPAGCSFGCCCWLQRRSGAGTWEGPGHGSAPMLLGDASRRLRQHIRRIFSSQTAYGRIGEPHRRTQAVPRINTERSFGWRFFAAQNSGSLVPFEGFGLLAAEHPTKFHRPSANGMQQPRTRRRLLEVATSSTKQESPQG